LFHYTTIRGLRGIVQTKQIWATDARFLNDWSEIDYVATVADRLIDIRRHTAPERINDLRELQNILTTWRRTHSRPGGIYVCSLSENGNQLSQWRGYCPNGGGVSIEFDSVELHTSMFPRGIITVKISYEKSYQEQVVDGLLDYLLYGNVPDAYAGASRAESANEEFAQLLSFLAPALKHPGFAEEAEWRLIYSTQFSKLFRIMSDSVPGLIPSPPPILKTEYREAPRMLVPYVALPLTDENLPLSFASVILGPSMEANLLEETVKGYLASTEVQVGSITSSGIPLRMP